MLLPLFSDVISGITCLQTILYVAGLLPISSFLLYMGTLDACVRFPVCTAQAKNQHRRELSHAGGEMSVCFHGEIILPDRTIAKGYLICEEGFIVEIAEKAPKNGPVITGRYITPGFVDLHVHGGQGADYMDGTAEAVRTVNRAHARHGTTTLFPTTTTGTTAQIHSMLNACAEVREHWSATDGSRIGGVHYYGPYFAEDKVGCHDREARRDPDPVEYEAFLSTGLIAVATCAAELPGAEEFYRAARAHNCLVTCGHSNSTWTEMERAYQAGVRHVDHFWCAMSSVTSLRARCGTPMQASMEQFVLATPR